MLKLQHGELPTNLHNKSDAIKHLLFHHYLNHKVSDIDGSKIDSDITVLECIINSFNRKFKPETYSIESSLDKSVKDDSLQDIRSVAHLAVWEATEKYLWGSNKKVNGKEVCIRYQDKFDFCVFASKQVEYKLRTHLRLLNINRICGKLPDSDNVRYLYSKLPKHKFDKKSLTEKDFQKISEENKIELDEVKLVDNFITTQTKSGDETIKNERDEDVGNMWEKLEETQNENSLNLDYNIENKTHSKFVITKFYEIKSNFLKNLSARDKEILTHTKFKDMNNFKELTLKKLGKKYNLSPERIRQIAEIKFLEFKKIIIKNKKNLELE